MHTSRSPEYATNLVADCLQVKGGERLTVELHQSLNMTGIGALAANATNESHVRSLR